ncbi:hypothetical protein [Variovorax sp. PBL-H6]|uniref:hypothetical protein n=1 Tax=Variovorax sp. PBL-H6 TaxID=434009 RepID=UPI0013A555B5|nr:hypothetical protein [Variovorax sp. PBL-H6]
MSADTPSYVAVHGHDAEIVSIDIDRENSVCRLGFTFEREKRSSLELFEVVAFRVEDFSLQNVVSRILRATAKDFSEDDLSHWLDWATSLPDAPSWLKSERKREWVDALNDGRLALIVLEPSAGAQIVAV